MRNRRPIIVPTRTDNTNLSVDERTIRLLNRFNTLHDAVEETVREMLPPILAQVSVTGTRKEDQTLK